jgi:SAM-dependent methyltransferase
MMLGIDLIQEVDFDAMHRLQCERSSFGSRGPAEWDSRAVQRDRWTLNSDYSKAFLDRMNLEGARSALDIGCGSGNLAVPLAQQLKKVVALDFSPEMLRLLKKHCSEEGVDNVEAHCLSWSDPWKGIPKVDIAVCSRAMGGAGLLASLKKMNRKARLRCYLTLHAGGSFLSPDILELLDREIAPRPDYIYAVNLLYQMGIRAQVDFLRSTGGMSYASAARFVESVQWRIGPLSTKEKSRLRQYYKTLPRTKKGGGQTRHQFDWALLSWETPKKGHK